ncbi:MAG: hypothetical protein HWE26_09435 [Alteromonadaceae bacterium]|nr:hypothetical protein [Alteromonadaceae bacterium]
MSGQFLPFTNWQRFVQGLTAFAVGLAVMVIGAWWILPLYYLGLAILFTGFGWAMSGYLGMLWQRLTKSINPHSK